MLILLQILIFLTLPYFLSAVGFIQASWKKFSDVFDSPLEYNYFSFSIRSDPAFDFIEPVSWLTFGLVNSFVLLCILAVFVLLILSISAQFSLSHSFLACLHFFLIVVFSVRYSFSFIRIVCCSFYISRFSFFIHSFLSCFVYLGMISFAESIVLLGMFHFDFVISFRLHLFLLLFLYDLKTNK